MRFFGFSNVFYWATFDGLTKIRGQKWQYIRKTETPAVQDVGDEKPEMSDMRIGTLDVRLDLTAVRALVSSVVSSLTCGHRHCHHLLPTSLLLYKPFYRSANLSMALQTFHHHHHHQNYFSHAEQHRVDVLVQDVAQPGRVFALLPGAFLLSVSLPPSRWRCQPFCDATIVSNNVCVRFVFSLRGFRRATCCSRRTFI